MDNLPILAFGASSRKSAPAAAARELPFPRHAPPVPLELHVYAQRGGRLLQARFRACGGWCSRG